MDQPSLTKIEFEILKKQTRSFDRIVNTRRLMRQLYIKMKHETLRYSPKSAVKISSCSAHFTQTGLYPQKKEGNQVNSPYYFLWLL